MNHRWSLDVVREPNQTDRTCTRCGVVKRTRLEPPKFWTEYRCDGVKLDARPDCTKPQTKMEQ